MFLGYRSFIAAIIYSFSTVLTVIHTPSMYPGIVVIMKIVRYLNTVALCCCTDIVHFAVLGYSLFYTYF